jgi:PAS domain S-box-containing protein
MPNSTFESDGALPQPDFELLFRSVPAMCLVLTPDLRIVAASETYMRAAMVTLESVRGRILFEVFPDDPNDPHASGERNLRDSLLRVVALRAPDAMAVQRYPIRHADGGFEERFWSPVNFPVLDGDGDVIYLIHRVEDVTELVRLRRGSQPLVLEPTERLESDVLARAQEIQEANRRLREVNQELGARHLEDRRRSEVVLQSIVSTAIDGIITIDERGRVLTYNRAAEQMFGYSADEVIDKNVKMLMPEPYRQEHDGYLQSYHRTGVAKIIGSGREVVGRRKDGTMFPMELAVSRFEQDGRPCFTGLVRDVTARKRMESQLRQAQKMEAVGQLAAGVAHDFNNLLTVISGYSELLMMSLAAGDKSLPMVFEVKGAAERAAQLTKQLLAFSRQQVMEPRVFELNPLIVESERMLQRLIGEDIELVSRLATDLWSVNADPGQISQVVMNLAVNSRDAMPTGGMITIETRNVDVGDDLAPTRTRVTPGAYVLLTISDTGSGMTPDVAARVFEPFFTTKEVGKGTGLGLSVVHGIVEQCGGHVDVYTEPGIGTAFKVYLPAVRRAAEHADARREPGEEKYGTETVLLVEDDAAVRKFAVLSLQQYGYHVLEASNGPEGLYMLNTRGGKLDLLITDVVMPGMSGRQLAEAVEARFPDIKVLYMSGYTDDAIVKHGVLESEIQFLNKPFTHDGLVRKVREVLDAG